MKKNRHHGLTTPETSVISSPGDKVTFSDPKTAVEKAIKELKDQNVNKIIVLSHLGYDADQELARQADGIDIIVGGHTHTLLGDYKSVGLTAQG
ncbi:MAG: multifunctional 2',3'-cyclic-nucleotide 2'-phosphodiesterase/5'-nucleotidase/3'-nucleotidase, partial [Desulfobacteraceae bacterium]|nr:multifunctional 2',3'-cyclic-nucleotide 2'-phosphodiesterase/5'-nucleotidase/3'-nucleotidase [Desulfobacteraceae bacterium]